jgi:hypothetical protein
MLNLIAKIKITEKQLIKKGHNFNFIYYNPLRFFNNNEYQ